MNEQEFSLEFDLLYNNIFSNQAPGLDEYEKSLFLTEAQEAMVIGLYTGQVSAPFESTEEVTDYLSPLVRQAVITETVSGDSFGGKSVFFAVPEDVWFKTGETAVIKDTSLSCNGNDQREVDVVPVTQDRWYRTINNPYRGPNERRVLRMDPSGDKVELFSVYPIVSYTVRYLAQPEPIILTDIGERGLSINGKSNPQTCKLHESLHRPILVKAVELAKSVWRSTAQ